MSDDLDLSTPEGLAEGLKQLYGAKRGFRAAASEELGVAPTTLYRWLHGTLEIPKLVVVAVRAKLDLQRIRGRKVENETKRRARTRKPGA